MSAKSTISSVLVVFFIIISSQLVMAQRFRLEENADSQLEVSFDAYKIGNTIQFVWNTNNEANISSYELVTGVESGRFLEWKVLSLVKARKSSRENYVFVDEQPALGEMQYRLKIVAPDGSSVEYSPLFHLVDNVTSAKAL